MRRSVLMLVLLLPAVLANAVSPKWGFTRGAFGVGVSQFQLEIGGGMSTTVNVWYPVKRRASNSADDYAATVQRVQFPAETTSLSSPRGMALDALPARGPFPLILQIHGGPGPVPAPTDINGLFHAPLNEIVAASGFVVASYTRRNWALGPLAADDAAAVIEEVQARFPEVDRDVIGLAGESHGATEVLELATRGDTRIRGLLLQDAGATSASRPGQIEEITAPVLLLSGSALSDQLRIDEFFEAAERALPRYLVGFNTVSHAAFMSGFCQWTEHTRAIELQRQFDLGLSPLQEPLIQPSPSSSGIQAFISWNFASIFGNPPLGSGSEFCETVGTDNPLLSTDLDGDGIADGYTGTNFLGERVLAGHEVNKLHARFAVAFWKVHLKGDRRYARFLSGRYAARDSRVSLEKIPSKRRRACLRADHLRGQRSQARAQSAFYKSHCTSP